MKVLITGGAGFIGSHLAETMLEEKKITLVRVVDNLATGHRSNIRPYLNHPKFEFIWGDIREYTFCLEMCKGMDRICHQAALGSIPRSIKHPLTINNVNITGTLNIFTAAKEMNIKRVVYAASSSTYGNSQELPKRENNIGVPLSPHAVTKLVNELYAKVFGDLYNMEFIGLRYFNVFGLRQDPNGAYAAVIPLFTKSLLEGKSPTINGDGTQSRDFTYVTNVVKANLLALFTKNPKAVNQVYNIACGERISINELFESLKIIAQSSVEAKYGPARFGDVQHSIADISKAQELLNYTPDIKVKEGLKLVYNWYQRQENNTSNPNNL